MKPKIEFETVNCLICESTETVDGGSIQWRDTDFGYVLCRRCGLKYMNPRPTLEWYRRFYEEEFWQEKVTNKGFKFEERQAREERQGVQKKIEKQKLFATRISDLVTSAISLDSGSTVLEIGASWGVTLQMLHDRTGCRTLAVEPSAIAREHMRNQFGITLIGHTMEDLAQTRDYDQKIDAVIFSHVLENIIDPIEALHVCHRMLSDTGVLYIDTCNFYYNDAMNPYHPYIFAPETLQALLARTGFETVAVHSDPSPPQEKAPTDLYLKVIARKTSRPIGDVPPVDVAEMLKNQQIGIARIQAGQPPEGQKTGIVDKILARIFHGYFLKNKKR